MRSHFLRAANDKAVSCSYVTTVTNTADNSNYFFGSTNIGTAAADRYVVVVVQTFGANTNISNVAIGATNATLHSNTSATFFSGFAGLLVTSGTTASITVNMNAIVSRIAISVYAIYGLNSSTPLSNLSAITTGTTATISNMSTEYGGVVIASVGSSSTNSYTLSGVTEQYDQILESTNRYAGGFDLTTSKSTSYTVSSTSSASQNSRLVALSWR